MRKGRSANKSPHVSFRGRDYLRPDEANALIEARRQGGAPAVAGPVPVAADLHCQPSASEVPTPRRGPAYERYPLTPSGAAPVRTSHPMGPHSMTTTVFTPSARPSRLTWMVLEDDPRADPRIDRRDGAARHDRRRRTGSRSILLRRGRRGWPTAWRRRLLHGQPSHDAPGSF